MFGESACRWRSRVVPGWRVPRLRVYHEGVEKFFRIKQRRWHVHL